MDEYYFTKNLPALEIKGQEVIRTVDSKPHLLARVIVQGTYFPQRALVPFMRIKPARGKTVSAWFTEITPQETGLVGYFPVDLPPRGIIEFGYGNQVMDRFELTFERRKLARLNRKLVDKEAVEVTTKFLQAKASRAPEIQKPKR